MWGPMLPRTTTRGPLDKRGVDMDTSDTTHTPEESGLLRRGLFPRREQAQADPMTETEARLDETVRRAVDDRVEAGMRQIEDSGHRPDPRGGHRGLAYLRQRRAPRAGAHHVAPRPGSGDPVADHDQRRAVPGDRACAPRGSRTTSADLAESERRTREAMESGVGCDPRDLPVPHAARRRDGAHAARAGRAAPRRDVHALRRARPRDRRATRDSRSASTAS